LSRLSLSHPYSSGGSRFERQRPVTVSEAHGDDIRHLANQAADIVARIECRANEDDFTHAVYALSEAVERLEKLFADCPTPVPHLKHIPILTDEADNLAKVVAALRSEQQSITFG
jgi:hypothetical protein